MRVDRSHLPEVGADPSFSFPAIARHTLANGLQVLTVEHDVMPIVTFALIVDGGSGSDPGGSEGLAALVADMADEGTGTLSAIDLSDALARIGAVYDVDVEPDACVFTLTTLTRCAERGASLLADMVTRPSLARADFDRVRKLRIDRLKQLDDSPPFVAERAFLRRLYGGHPYGHLAIGRKDALTRLTLDDVAVCHRSAFRPSRSALVVAGATADAALLEIVVKAFGGWEDPGDGPGVRAVTAEPQQAVGGIAVVSRDGAAQSELRIGHLSARRDTPDYAALLVMNAVLGGQFVSRINLKLREEKGYTYGARTGFDWRRGLSPFSLQASVHTAATADAVRDSFSELDAIRRTRPVSEAELALAKSSLTRGYPRGFETVQQVARAVTQLVVYGLPDTYFAEFVPSVNRVSRADVTRVAERYVDPARLVTVIVGDIPEIGATVRALGLGEPEVLGTEG